MYTMKDVCKLARIPYETLKFYCNRGLIPNVQRDKNNFRVFDQHDVEWIKSLVCLKKCGMSLQEMKTYLDYCLAGPVSIPQRKAMLAEKQQKLYEQLKELQESIAYIDWKQQFYDDVQSGKIEYKSHLIKKG